MICDFKYFEKFKLHFFIFNDKTIITCHNYSHLFLESLQTLQNFILFSLTFVLADNVHDFDF